MTPSHRRALELAAQQGDAFYKTREWKEVRARFLALHRREHGRYVCAHCQETIEAKPTVDHIERRTKRPELALTPGNLQLLHSSCHSSWKATVERNEHKPMLGDDGLAPGW